VTEETTEAKPLNPAQLREEIEELLERFNQLRRSAKAQKKSLDPYKSRVAAKVCHMLDTLEPVVTDARNWFNEGTYWEAWLAYGRAMEQLAVAEEEFRNAEPPAAPKLVLFPPDAERPDRRLEGPPPSGGGVLDTVRGATHHARARRNPTTEGARSPEERR